MPGMCRLALVLLLIVSAASSAAASDGLPYGKSLNFVVMREGVAIGRHTLIFERDDSQLRVATSIDIAVKFMGFTAYRYSHRAEEVWAGDALVALSSRTDDNGTKYAVQASRTADGLAVQAGAAGGTVLPAGILPTSHWNIRQVAQPVLLNSQKGGEARVKITPLGREIVATTSRSLPATRYRYDGDIKMDQWFDDHGRWVKTSFKGSDDSTIEYLLQE